MKKIIFSIAVLMGVSAANFSFAGGKVSDKTSAVEIVASNNLKFKLTLDSVKDRSSVVIKDSDGTIVYSTTIPKSENYSKIFDLSNLSDGNYSFVVNNGTEVTAKPFAISTETKRLVTAVAN